MIHDMVDMLVPVSEPQTEFSGKDAIVSLTSSAVSTSYTGLAIQGFSSADTLSGWVRFEDQGNWGPWLSLYIVPSATDNAFLAAYRSDIVRVEQRFALRFVIGTTDSLHILSVGVFDNRRDTTAPHPDQHAPQKSDNFLIIAPTLLDRSTWNARPFRGSPIPLNRPTYTDITLHHTAGFSATTMEEGLEQVQRIQDFHQNGRGWSDIGYQFLMDQEGRLYQGRPFLNNQTAFTDGPPLAQGAHVGGHNTGNIGVSLMGCYHPPEGSNCVDRMTSAATDSLLVMFAYLSERYGVVPDDISGHRDFNSTACPGNNNYAMLPSIRLDTEELLTTGNAQLGDATLRAVADTTGVVSLFWFFLQNNGILTFEIERSNSTGSTIITRQSSIEDGRFVDLDVGITGLTTYTLHAFGTGGRTQMLANTEVVITSPKDFVMTQNFPNPFTSTTSIRYFLKQPGIVHLLIYDLAGREISSLEQNWRESGQWYTTTFDASNLPGGLYFYHMKVKGFSNTVYQTTKPLIVLK